VRPARFKGGMVQTLICRRRDKGLEAAELWSPALEGGSTRKTSGRFRLSRRTSGANRRWSGRAGYTQKKAGSSGRSVRFALFSRRHGQTIKNPTATRFRFKDDAKNGDTSQEALPEACFNPDRGLCRLWLSPEKPCGVLFAMLTYRVPSWLNADIPQFLCMCAF